MHSLFGNVDRREGYACLIKELLVEWRKLWSEESGTTDPSAPFGFVTLVPSGNEGGKSIGAMRWAQTAGYGYAPNEALPNTFMAQGYDLDDPYVNITCYNKFKCPKEAEPAGGWPADCRGYCDSVEKTNFYMGPIHPRDKRPVGKRLAYAGMSVMYGDVRKKSNGPTLVGCALKENDKLHFHFTNSNDVIIQPYYDGSVPGYPHVGSKMQVLTNASLFCMQLKADGTCLDDGDGNALDYTIPSDAWQFVNIRKGKHPNAVVADLNEIRNASEIVAVRYAFTGDCCTERPPTSAPCDPASCPLVGALSNLPANPFVAKVNAKGVCECLPPLVCDGYIK